MKDDYPDSTEPQQFKQDKIDAYDADAAGDGDDMRLHLTAPALIVTHTPGPWMVDDETVNHGPIIIQRNGAIEVAQIYGDSRKQRVANARLIAAAPELLEALNDLFRHCAMIHKQWGEGSNQSEADRAIAKAHAAISKAEGK